MKKFVSVILIASMMLTGAWAQYVPSKERGDSNYRRKAQLEGNNVRTTIFNFGQTGRQGAVPISVETPYEWPKNTGKVYLALTALFMGAEIIDEDGELQHVVDVANYRNAKDDNTKSWSLEPVPGYFNTDIPSNKQTIANSVDPDTWPSFWPDKMGDENDPGWAGSWNGYFGKNKFNADQEIYYRASDDNYDRYNYFPDTTDLTRHGLGVMLDVRNMAWSQILVSDVVYLLHTFKNDGTKDLQKFATTLWDADFVGGDGDSQDDISDFDLIEDIIWSRDADNKAPTFGNDPVGIVGVALLETPGIAIDRVDNDGDGEANSPEVTEAMLAGEDATNLIDDNGNGLIDENETHVAFGTQKGVGFADHIDNDGNGEDNSPLVTQEMVDLASGDQWKRWPVNPVNDPVNLLEVDASDVGHAFRDFIDNNDNSEEGSPVVTQEMIDQAAGDAPYFRYRVPGTKIILYDVKAEDLGKKYADGVDNDGNGAVDENIDEGIDEMIDERRDDGIDNDGDWNPLLDDVGLDGVAGTNDTGENDGLPTSGAGTSFPGEPDIDVTDVSETDQIGITNAARVSAGALDLSNDATTWFNYMIPGKFYDPQSVVAGEFDVLVSSAYFPLRAGQTEPVSIAVILANGPSVDPNGEFRKQAVLKKRVRAQETYENDYQFANAPVTPTLTAIPGDNKVTLYWDNLAETTFDSYINNIGGNGNDFEGYRIYRATDPAMQDAKIITNGAGEVTFSKPIAQFDRIDNYMGYDSVGIDGVKFYLGNNSGLQHSWVDETARNGFTYYYVITSYDFGFPQGQILPTESPFRINVRGDGSIQLGKNVARVTPSAPAAGYVPATLGSMQHLAGTSSGEIDYDIVDPNKIKNNHVYYVTFQDTIRPGKGGESDTLTTLNFTLTDSTDGKVVIDSSTHLEALYEQPLTDGFRLSFKNEEQVELNRDKSGWNNSNVPNFEFTKLTQSNGDNGKQIPFDYDIIFGDPGYGRSTEIQYENQTWPAKDVNFRVYNKSTGEFIKFGFVDLDIKHGGEGFFGAGRDTLFNIIPIVRKDVIAFIEKDQSGTEGFTWQFKLLNVPEDSLGQRNPVAGDTAKIVLRKPFLHTDVYRFVAKTAHVLKKQEKAAFNNIKVVPNPYRGYAAFESKSIYNSGRAERALHFTHLPAKCTIRIYTINGELVKKIEHDTDIANGTENWNMLSKDNLAISYGIYIYYVDAPGVGQKTGKFAVIK